MSMYLKDAHFIDWETLEIRRTHIRVEEGDGGTSFVDEIPALKKPVHGDGGSADRVIDCSGKYVTRAFGCGHHHIYSALARGMPPSPKSPRNFHEILKFIWWRLDKALDKDSIRASALVTALYCLKNGVAFVIDHHSSPGTEEGSLDIIAEVLEEAGVSHLLCYEISDRDGPQAAEAGLAETERYLKRRKGLVGLHASFTVGDALFRRAVALAASHNTGIHIHTAEDRIDQEHCRETYGKGVAERYEEMGMFSLGGNILTHCLYLSAEEWDLLKGTGVWIAQAAESNLNNGVGAYKGPACERFMLGTDGMHSDMLRSAKISYFLAQGALGPALDGKPCPPAEIYRRFRNVHRYAGQVELPRDAKPPGDGGKDIGNNLVILNYDSPTVLTKDNFSGHFIYGIEGRHVEYVISSGKLVYEKGRVLTLNEEDVLAFAKEQASAVWRRMADIKID